MPVTVADLLARSELGLVLLTADAIVDRPLSWVHVSELADPAPFLEGGELLLTTGLALRQDQPAGPYVRRLVDAGVAALGFGTGLGQEAVLPELLAAAEKSGLPVVDVPRGTPFIAISRSVSAALAAEEYAAVARSAAVQQELTRAAVAPGAPGALLERLARAIGGWALLLDTVGAPLEAAPPGAVRHAHALGTELDRLRGSRAPASAAISGPEDTVLVQSLGTNARIRGFLAVGRSGSLPPTERHVVNAAALLLTLRMEQSRGLDSAMAALRAALLRLLLAGEERTVSGVVDELGQQLPSEPLRVLTVLGSGEQRSAAVDVAADAAAHGRVPLFSAELDDALVLLTSAETGLASQLDVLPARVPGSAVGMSRPVRWSELVDGLQQARQAAQHGRGRTTVVVDFEDLATPGLSALLEPTATRAFADSLLAPLFASDRAGAGDLVHSVRVWLTHHGQWEPAAAQLGVHRHTLRKRVRRAGQLLGRDLDEPGTRAELWIALHPPGAS
ncbi:PucR family transcriptional regulator [Modestobacter sp. VKM Ac-2978]|uniref:PucR family transcriptional regulator n=1 Tax=Modestobacter sp. VKM Ac-2978 TaxID=3004132 RepID=UPI0022AAAB70|nr:PucR family transcriptional regulator [Modestobacter sp. VKM Ac-2978]MCZ2849883.1 PucR family transcriptional regulator [Modestobacter sp. VKM Ac-2978]